MRPFINLFCLLVLILSSACSHNQDKKYQIQELVIEAQTDDMGVFGNLSSVTGLVFGGDGFYVADQQNSTLLQLDFDLKPHLQYGQKGTGPGEFQGVGHIALFNNSLYAFNHGSQHINVFDKEGSFQNQISLPSTLIMTRFFVRQGLLFISTPTAEKPITIFDSKGDVIRQFGTYTVGESFREKRARNYKHLLPFQFSEGEGVVAVSMTEPMIELFSVSGELIKRRHFEKNAFLFNRLQFQRAEYKQDHRNKESSYGLFIDAVLDGDDLYVVPYGQPPYATVMRFKITSEDVVFMDAFQLIHDQADISAISKVPGGPFFVWNQKARQLQRLSPKGIT